jgi:hypothetical protein
MRKKKVPFNGLADALAAAGITPENIRWHEASKGRRFAPLPRCKLRALARKHGFLSSAEFLAAEKRRHA